MNPLTPSTHNAPFKQGFGLHSLISEETGKEVNSYIFEDIFKSNWTLFNKQGIILKPRFYALKQTLHLFLSKSLQPLRYFLIWWVQNDCFCNLVKIGQMDTELEACCQKEKEMYGKYNMFIHCSSNITTDYTCPSPITTTKQAHR